uniref:hypothetical protein n=1 Tax=Kitasatospora indigofera TaxID=67307 RepID=UPI002F90C959
MTGANPVHEHIDALGADQNAACDLLERAIRLPRHAGRTLRLAVAFHRRAETAMADLDDFINHLERHGR